jgi:uncharacterized protein YjbI with pentapeptide repeats
MSCRNLKKPKDSNNKIFTNCLVFDIGYSGYIYTKCVFRQIKFQYCLFEHAQFIECEFYDVQFENTNFSYAQLQKTKFENCTFTKAHFGDTNFTGANLSGLNLAKNDFTAANFTGADLTGANLSGADLTEANLSGAVLIEADLTKATLIEADLTKATLMKAKLLEANLSGANLTDANLTDANLSGAKFTDATDAITILTGAILTGADLRGVELTGIDMTGVDLTKAITGNFDYSVNISPSYKAIPRHQIGFHIFDMEVEVLEYLKSTEGMNAVAFLYYNTYYLIDKSTLAQLINPKSQIKSLVRGENILLMKVEALGIPLRFSYIPVSYIKYTLKTSNKIENRMFELVSTGEKIEIENGDSGLSFKLKKIKNAGNIVLNTIRRAATANKTKKGKVGGRKTTRHISKKNELGGKNTRQVSKKNKYGNRKTIAK